MKTFVVAYNYLTLCKAIVYTNQVWGIDNTLVFYYPTVSEFPSPLKTEYNCVVIQSQYHNINRTNIGRFYAEAHYYRDMSLKTYNEIKKRIYSNDEKFNLIVFKDNEIREATLIAIIKKKYNNASIVLIEEGIGIYNNTLSYKEFILKRFVKKVIYTILQIPTVVLDRIPQGYNRNIDIIICKMPELLKLRGCSCNALVEKEISIFNPATCSYFLDSIYRIKMEFSLFKFVFLTQPLFPSGNEENDKEYDLFLRELINIIKPFGRLLIKTHFRDNWDYSVYKDATICPRYLQKIPFECINLYYGCPMPLTLFSTAACVGGSKFPGVFLYKCIKSMNFNISGLNSSFLKAAGLISCDSLNDFKNVLNDCLKRDIG